MEDEYESICADSAENCKIIIDWIFDGHAFAKSVVTEGFSSDPVSWLEKGRVYGRKKHSAKPIKKLVNRKKEDFWPLIGKWWLRNKDGEPRILMTSDDWSHCTQENWEIAPLGTEEWQPMMKEVEVEECAG